jgi:hypothetical protein
MSYVSDELRRAVRERASTQCEYCLINEQYTMKPHEVDHIYAEKHGGPTTIDNLCLSCFDCNRYKGSDLCTLDESTGEIVVLFHPRRHTWNDHFTIIEGVIVGTSAEGRATLRLLRMNTTVRVDERRRLSQLGRYP